MDPKSLAKSKRSFTQSHSKKSHHSIGKGSGNSNQVDEKPSKEKIHLSRDYLHSQPSNQGRFDDSFQLNPEGENSATSNVVVHKSSGADYRLLISDAETMPRVDACLDPFAALDDVLPDFRQGLNSMLSVRGEGVFSLINDDIFLLDEAPKDPETPFLLSIDLPTLARRLQKVELSKRLFVDADTPLPCTDTLAETSGRVDADPDEARKSYESGEDKQKGRPDRPEFDVTTETDSRPVHSTASWKPAVDRATFSATLDDENKDAEKKMLECEAEDALAELDMLLNSTVFLTPPSSSNHGQSRVTDSVGKEYHKAVPGEIISGFDEWLDTI